MSKFAWVTLTTNDSYGLGALVLAHSLLRQQTAHQLAVLVTPGVSEDMRNRLRQVYNLVQEVDVYDSEDATNLALLKRPELGVTFTKLHCWRLVQYEKCVFLDSDTLVLQNCDELFEREELSAAPDVSWPDCFNSGVFVFKPSMETFTKIAEFAYQEGSFDGGDQGLLNSYYNDWATADIKKHLPFIYNVTAFASYCYLPAFKQFRDKIKILHFAGKLKPWLLNFNSESKLVNVPSDYAHAADLIQLWWTIFCENVHRELTGSMNYWPAITPWNFNKQSYTSQAYCENDAYEELPEYRDPWQDYYEQLQVAEEENLMPVAEIINETCTETETETKTLSFNEHFINICAIDAEAAVAEDTQECDYALMHNASIIEITNTQTDTAKDQVNHDMPELILTTETQTANTEVCQCQAAINSRPELSTYDTFATDTDLAEHIDCETHVVNVAMESGLAGALAQLRLGEQRTPEQEAYEQLMRREAWEQGQIDYKGKDSFDNIWKRITETLESKPTTPPKDGAAASDLITSADIEDGKIEYDPVTKAKIEYKVVDGGYQVITTTPQPNGTVKTQTQTFWDPKPVSAEDLMKEQENKKLVRKRFGKEIRIDSRTTMLTREIEGGYEEVYTVMNEDGTKSVKVKTFYDSVPEGQGFPNAANAVTPKKPQTAEDKRKKQLVATRNSSVDSTDSTESRKVVQRKNVMQSTYDGKNTQVNQYQEESTFQESRRMSQNVEISQNSRTVRKNSTQDVQAITYSNDSNDSTQQQKKKKKTKSAIPPPPPDFIENDTTKVKSQRVPGGIEYTYTTQLESGKTITTSKTIYEEEETELTEEEIREYKKTLKDAEKHKNVTSTKKLRSESGTKKVVPSENPGDVTTVETIRIEGGTEYHYTTVTSAGIVKKAVKTVYDPVPVNKYEDESEEEEIVEEYEEEIIEPGEKNIRTIESIKKLPTQFQEEVTITKEKKEKKVKRSMIMSN